MSIKSNDNLDLKPLVSKSKKYIKLNFPNIRVSQVEYKEGPVGLTFIEFTKGARVYMEVTGGWPSYINSLSTNYKQHLNGINIAGGSILGLESTTGITVENLKHSKYKYSYLSAYNGSVIYSNNLNTNKIYPDKDLGRFAYNNFGNVLYNGQVGAGLSATHGQGWEYKNINGIKILALVVNNALGSVYKNNKALHHPMGKKTNTILNDIKLNKNTTIIVLVTNLDLDIDELKQMNNQVNVSIGATIRPFNTFADGDVFYTCSTREIKKKFTPTQLIKLFDICSDVIQNAILNSVK